MLYLLFVILILIVIVIWIRNPNSSGNYLDSKWTNAHVRKIIPDLIQEFGQPAYDINISNGLIAWQNVGYNQPPHPSFYVGDDMKKPAKPTIALAKSQSTIKATVLK